MATSEHAKPKTEEVIGSRFEMVKSFGIKPTLNGKPAIIAGYSNRFATVREIESGLSADWSWEAVRIVMSHGGAFQS